MAHREGVCPIQTSAKDSRLFWLWNWPPIFGVHAPLIILLQDRKTKNSMTTFSRNSQQNLSSNYNWSKSYHYCNRRPMVQLPGVYVHYTWARCSHECLKWNPIRFHESKILQMLCYPWNSCYTVCSYLDMLLCYSLVANCRAWVNCQFLKKD